MKLSEILTENVDDDHFEASAEFAVAAYLAKKHKAIPSEKLNSLRDQFRKANKIFGDEYDNDEDDQNFYEAILDMQDLGKGLSDAVKKKLGASVYDKEEQAVYDNDEIFDKIIEELLS